ncbi:MAG: PorT family protein [Bacteroidales bacterium]|nr:PorT family protein [Bacteroidales bacterium]MCF8398675.1 PorT family protein [Bacteroidales bacterium]
MKRKTILLLTIILANTCLAQVVSVGLQGGVNYSWINGRFDFKNFKKTEINSVLSPQFNFKLNYKLTKNMSLQTGVGYQLQGFDFENDPWLDGLAYCGSYESKYLSVPLLIALGKGDGIKLYILAGFSLQFPLNVDNTTTLTSIFDGEVKVYDYSYDPSNEFNDFALSGILGAGMEIPFLKNFGVTLDVSYQQGITKAVKDTDYEYDSHFWTEETPNNFQNVRNCSVALNLGVVYTFSRMKDQ